MRRIRRCAPSVLVGALFLLLVAAGSAVAQLRQVTVDVDGLACPFCAYTLEKELKKVAGVAEVAIHVADANAVLVAGEAGWIDLDAIDDAIREAGFTPRQTRLRVRGRLEEDAEGRLYLVAGGHRRFEVLAGEDLASGDHERAGQQEYEGWLVVESVDGGNRSSSPGAPVDRLPLLSLVPPTPADGSEED